MRYKLVIICITSFIFFLSGCSASNLTLFLRLPTADIALTQTPLHIIEASPLPPTDTSIPPTDTPVPPTDTPLPTSTPTVTATSIPTDTPTLSMTVNLEAVGDIMLARMVGQQVQVQGPQVVFAGVQSVLDGADVLVGNLECAITSGGNPQHKTYTFAAPPETTQALANAGFDILSLANNHAMDFGVAGLTDTVNNLNQFGIASVGAGRNAVEAHTPVILVRNGLRMAFLGYANVPVENGGFNAQTWIATNSQPGIAWAAPEQIKADVTAAKNEADVVIVLLHSGYEITSIIPNISTDQRLAAHAAIDAGAALVIGSHPHFLESIERYKTGLIAYSLGNFVFDDYQGIANASIILRVVLTTSGYQSYEWSPVLIKNGLPFLTDVHNIPAIGTMIAPLNP